MRVPFSNYLLRICCTHGYMLPHCRYSPHSHLNDHTIQQCLAHLPNSTVAKGDNDHQCDSSAWEAQWWAFPFSLPLPLRLPASFLPFFFFFLFRSFSPIRSPDMT
uniref:Uncharacterized protein n=1 Tax=Trypanosoma vivax (strain Y486) TaxID=1055687 RepID=G0UCZ4_TRYVY|nr:hypothetical protein, unlikely [Trypanosoma vivax Y486]